MLAAARPLPRRRAALVALAATSVLATVVVARLVSVGRGDHLVTLRAAEAATREATRQLVPARDAYYLYLAQRALGARVALEVRLEQITWKWVEHPPAPDIYDDHWCGTPDE